MLHLRGNNKIKDYCNEEDLNVQIIDWKTCDQVVQVNNNNPSDSEDSDSSKTESQYLITIFGITEKGNSVCVDINGFKPYFYIRIPQKWTSIVLERFVSSLKKKLPNDFRGYIEEFKIVKRNIFRGFTNKSLYKFAKLIFKNKKVFYNCKYIIQNNNESLLECKKIKRKLNGRCTSKEFNELTRKGKYLNKKIIKIPLNLPKGGEFPIFESNIDPMLRFIHERNISPSNWITIKSEKYHINEVIKSNCQMEFKTNYKNVCNNDQNRVSPIIIASYDIECDSSHGDFPLAKKGYKKLANNIFDLYKKHNLIRKSKKKDKYLQLFNNNKKEFIEEIIRIAYLPENNVENKPLPVDRIFSKNNIKPNSDMIDKLFQHHFCNSCHILIPIEHVEIENNKFTTKIKYDDLEYINKYTFKYKNKLELKIPYGKKFPCTMEVFCCHMIDPKRFCKCENKIGIAKKIEGTNTIKITYNKNSSIKECPLYNFYDTIISKVSKLNKRDTIITKCTNILNYCLPQVEGDKVIQIGTTVAKYGDSKCFIKHIVTLNTCDDIDGCIVESYETEREVLLAWSEFIHTLDPDMLTGWNIFGFDYDFIWKRAQELDCVDEFSDIGRIINEKAKLVNKKLCSSGLGDNVLKYIHMDGRIQMDLMKIIQRDHKLESYKLDFVASHFITGNILELTINKEGITTAKSNNVIGLNVGNYLTIFYKNVNGTVKYNDGQKIKIISIDFKNKTFQLYGKIEIDLKLKYQWGLSKDDVSPKDIFEMQKKGPKERAIIAKYCIQDCELCINLCNKLNLITNNIGMANVCSVPLSFIFLRGQGIKIFSLISKQCRKEKYLIPLLEKDDYGEREGYEGAIVLKPKPGIYLDEPVVVLDYASLYPSSMISENLSHETIVTNPEWLGETGGIVLKKMGFSFKDITYDNYKYVEKGKSFIKIINKSKPTVTCRFIQPKKKNGETIEETRGIIPRVLRKILGARKQTRKKIKYKTCELQDGRKVIGLFNQDGENIIITTESGEKIIFAKKLLVSKKDTYNVFEKAVYDGQQMAFKVTANSLYGSLGARTSQVYYKDIAASTTATGRRLIYLAKDFIEKNYEDSYTVYGDTDSVFMNFRPKDKDGKRLYGYDALKESIRLGTEAGEKISKLLEHPHDLEYEKTFWPFVLLSKKRYVGNKYETDPDKYKQTSMGIVLKRRDNAKIVKYIYGGVIDIIMNQRDIAKSIDFLKKSLIELLDGVFPLDQLIVTKSLKAYYKDPEKIAHKVLAERMGRRDPGNKPQPNERIPYVYINYKSRKGQIVLQGEKIEHPKYIIEKKLIPDYGFYITNQILKPVAQIYALVLEELEGYKRDSNYYKHKRRQLLSKGKEKAKVKDKIQQLRIKDVKDILFAEALRISENRKNGVKEITSWFKLVKNEIPVEENTEESEESEEEKSKDYNSDSDDSFRMDYNEIGEYF